jgi:hypothetical protein
MKALITLVMTCLLSLGAFADDFAVAVGVRSNSADAVPTGATVSSKTGFGAGVIGIFDIAPKFQGRTGFLYNQRNLTFKAASTDEDVNLAYIDIPVTAMYRFADYAGAFAGPVLALLASKDCKVTGGCPKDPESMSLGLQFGASFKFAPQMGGEVYYETIPSEFWKDIAKNAKTVGFNLLFTFE